MTYAQMKRLALQQLDEDPSDVDEYGDMLGAYINEGYQIALRRYVRPRALLMMHTNGEGVAVIEDDIEKIVEVKDEHGYEAWYTLSGDGRTLHTTAHDQTIRVLCIINKPDLVESADEPQMPSFAHSALVDYACYRFLSNGNMAKQTRAQFYYGQFMQRMSMVKPEGGGSVTSYKNLYAVTDARWTR